MKDYVFTFFPLTENVHVKDRQFITISKILTYAYLGRYFQEEKEKKCKQKLCYKLHRGLKNQLFYGTGRVSAKEHYKKQCLQKNYHKIRKILLRVYMRYGLFLLIMNIEKKNSKSQHFFNPKKIYRIITVPAPSQGALHQ